MYHVFQSLLLSKIKLITIVNWIFDVLYISITVTFIFNIIITPKTTYSYILVYDNLLLAQTGS